LALAAPTSRAGCLANSNHHRVERNGGGFQRRLELESRRSALTPSLQRHQPTLRAPVDAFARDTRANQHVCVRARSRLRARYTRPPIVACARSRSRFRARLTRAPAFYCARPTPARSFGARTLCGHHTPHVSMPVVFARPFCTCGLLEVRCTEDLTKLFSAFDACLLPCSLCWLHA
jgi:hypothetical protein